MRSILLLLGTLLLAIGGFVVYRVTQPTPQILKQTRREATPIDVEGGAPRVLEKIAPGDRPWIRNIDRQGRLASRFRADEYLPQGGGRVHVIHPQAEFFQYPSSPAGRDQRVQRIFIESRTGDIEVQQPAHASGPSASSGPGQASFEKGAAGPPKRGRLKDDVTIRIFPDAYGPHQAEPSMRLVTDNMTFDNETFEVTTAAFTDKDGKLVGADEVPITVTGDYEFQGRGLKLRWNDLEGRLEFLEVAHGDYLTILHPGKTNGGAGMPLVGGGDGNKGSADSAAPTTTPAAVPVVAVALAAPAVPPPPVVTPAASPARPAVARPSAKPAPPKATRHGPQPPYVATFDSDVRVTQGERGVSEKQLATADQMTVDFLSGQSKATTRPTTTPATASVVATTAGQPAPAVAAQDAPPEAPPTAPAAAETQPATVAVAPAVQRAGLPTTGPATRPNESDEAVTVRWSGKLHVVPIPTGPSTPPALRPGESVVHMTGEQAPVHVTRDGNDVRCARLDYRSPDGDAALYNSPAFPQVVLRQLAGAGGHGATSRPAAVAPGAGDGAAPLGPVQPEPDEAVIVTEAVDYSGTDRVAILHGKSEAQVQLKPDPADASRATHRNEPDVMDVKWQKQAMIYFLDRTAPGRAANGSASPGSASAGGAPAKAGMPGAQQLAIDHAHFEGDVNVRHPQLALDSQSLDAEFDPPGTAHAAAVALAAAPTTGPAGSLPSTRPAQAKDQANLRRLIATDAVTAQVTDEAGKKQNIECQKMVMDTGVSPAGKLYPKKIDFDGGPAGDAHAFDPTQDVKAAHIQATFVPGPLVQPTTAPSTAPSTETAMPAIAMAAPAPTTGPATRPGRSGPATRPAELDTVTATGRVRIATSEGALATADRMFVKMIDGSPHARLIGTPAAPGVPAVPARVVDAKKNIVVGPVITADPKHNTAAVEGTGTMHLIRDEAPARKPVTQPSFASPPVTPPATPPANVPATNPVPAEKSRPIDVTFKSGAVMDSANNLIDIRDAVSVVSTDPDGTVNTATGQHVRITLADKPPGAAHPAGTTRPAAGTAGTAGTPTGPSAPATGGARLPAPASTTQPATRPAKGDKSDPTAMDPMKNKVVTGVELEKDAIVKSSLADAQGAILREFELKSELIRYVLESTQPGAKGKILVPVPGQMLVRDHRPSGAANANGAKGPGAKGPGAKSPGGASTAAPGATANAADPGQSRGATAFQWARDLTYDEATNTAVLTGDVLIVHQDDDPKSEPAKLRADRVVAVFEPRPNPAAKGGHAPAAPAGAATDPTASLQIKSMTATGNVSVTRAGSTLTAPRMDYDPASGWMTAVGIDRFPASYTDAEGVNSCTARQIDWNAQTWNVKFKDIIARTGRRQPGQ